MYLDVDGASLRVRDQFIIIGRTRNNLYSFISPANLQLGKLIDGQNTIP